MKWYSTVICLFALVVIIVLAIKWLSPYLADKYLDYKVKQLAKNAGQEPIIEVKDKNGFLIHARYTIIKPPDQLSSSKV